MIRQYDKKSDVRLSKSFRLKEFHCKCKFPDCKKTYIHEALIEGLEELRTLIKRPLIITSGFRCNEHNVDIGGRPQSMHLKGFAADIRCPLISVEKLYAAAITVRVFAEGGIGHYKTFIHVDVRGQSARWQG